MVILGSQNKITDFFMILAWASPFKVLRFKLEVLNENEHLKCYIGKCFHSNFTKMSNFQPLEVSETQLQVGEKLNYSIQRFKGYCWLTVCDVCLLIATTRDNLIKIKTDQ